MAEWVNVFENGMLVLNEDRRSEGVVQEYGLASFRERNFERQERVQSARKNSPLQNESRFV